MTIHHANDNIPSREKEAEELLNKLTLDWVRTEFNVPQAIQTRCSQFFLRVWDGRFIATLINDGVMIIPGHSDWLVHWQSTPEVCKSAEKVGCSFREYKDKKYVVIKVWKAQHQEHQENSK